jgi:hypothetical protein
MPFAQLKPMAFVVFAEEKPQVSKRDLGYPLKISPRTASSAAVVPALRWRVRVEGWDSNKSSNRGVRDFAKFKPVSGQVFEGYKLLYASMTRPALRPR